MENIKENIHSDVRVQMITEKYYLSSSVTFYHGKQTFDWIQLCWSMLGTKESKGDKEFW